MNSGTATAFFMGLAVGLVFALMMALIKGAQARRERKAMVRHIRELEAELDFAAATLGLAKNRFAARLKDKLVEYADEPWFEEVAEDDDDETGRISGGEWQGRRYRFEHKKRGQE